MAKRTYTDADRAAVYAALLASDGNVKRSARETNIPPSTVRDWKTEWAQNGFPEELEEVLQNVIEDIVEGLQRVRDKALLELESLIERHELKGRELVAAVGMLTDKIRLYKGEATSRSESRMQLPEPEQLRELVAGFFSGAVAAAQDRAVEIDDAEWEPIPQGELSPPSEEVALID